MRRRYETVREFTALFLLSLPTLIVPGPSLAQGLNGFMPGAGRATIALSHTFESYENYWVGSRKIADPSLGQIETGDVSLWVDVGLCDDVALTANLAYVDVASDGPAPLAANGLQDRTFLLRYRFLSIDPAGAWLHHAFVAAAGYRAPAAAYEPNRIVALGDGTRDALFRIVYQIQADVAGAPYLATEFGYDLRGEESPDNMELFGELGATYRRASLSVHASRSWADGGLDIGDPGFTFPGLKAETLRVGAKIYYRVTPALGIAVSGFVTPDGRNVGEATGTSTALVFKI